MKSIWPFIWWAITLVPLGIVRILLILLGLVVVLFAVPFAKNKKSNSDAGQAILTYGGIFWLWGNDHDGLLGDRRRKWDIRWVDVWYPKLKWLSFTGLVEPYVNCYAAKYIWAAIRNPVNNLRFTKLYKCDLQNCFPQEWIGDEVVSDRVGMAGCHFIWAYRVGSAFPYAGLYFVRMWSQEQKKCFRLRLGFKIDAHDNDAVGFCTVIAPNKSVHGA